jgi:hypothetical protein
MKTISAILFFVLAISVDCFGAGATVSTYSGGASNLNSTNMTVSGTIGGNASGSLPNVSVQTAYYATTASQSFYPVNTNIIYAPDGGWTFVWSGFAYTNTLSPGIFVTNDGTYWFARTILPRTFFSTNFTGNLDGNYVGPGTVDLITLATFGPFGSCATSSVSQFQPAGNYVTASITNGLATTSYVQLALTNISSTNVFGVTNTNAPPSGGIGEYFGTNAPSIQFFITNNYTNILGLSLPAGDWDVEASEYVTAGGGSATTTINGWFYSALSTNSPANIIVDGTEVYSGNIMTAVSSGRTSNTLPRKRFSFNQTTVVYLQGRAIFTAGTMLASGQINARRVR